jgi:hypothetical protein
MGRFLSLSMGRFLSLSMGRSLSLSKGRSLSLSKGRSLSLSKGRLPSPAAFRSRITMMKLLKCNERVDLLLLSESYSPLAVTVESRLESSAY